MSQGFVYVLINHAMPGIVKIGRTARATSDRANELSTTGVPHDFVVVYDQQFLDCIEAEREIHEYFADFRVNKNREFFKISPREVIEFIQGVEGKLNESKNNSANDSFLYLYLASVGNWKFRIGIHQSFLSDSSAEEIEEKLIAQLNQAYELGIESAACISKINFVSFFLNEHKSGMEQVVIDSIRNRNYSFSRIKDSFSDDEQTFIFQGDIHNPNAPEALYDQVFTRIKVYVEENDLINVYKRKKLARLKQNI